MDTEPKPSLTSFASDVVPKAEVLKPKPKLHFILGQHGDEDISSLSHDRLTLEHMLTTNPTGKVYYFMEDVGDSYAFSKRVTQLVDQGHTPTTAFAMSRFYEQAHRYPNEAALPAIIAQVRRSNIDFVNETLSMLDEISVRYPGRLGFLVEGFRPEQTIKPGSTKDKLIDTNLARAAKFINEGKFDQAVTIYNQATDIVAVQSREREETISTILHDHLQKEGVSSFVIRIGATHTGLTHDLRQEDYDVEREFLGKDDQSTFLFDPDASYSRKRRMLPHKPTTKLEALRALVGGMIYESIGTDEEFSNEAARRQRMVQITYKILSKLETEEAMRIFEAKIKTTNFGAAVSEIASSIEI